MGYKDTVRILHRKEADLNRVELPCNEKPLPQVGDKIQIIESEEERKGKGNQKEFRYSGTVVGEYPDVIRAQRRVNGHIFSDCFRKNDFRAGILEFKVTKN